MKEEVVYFAVALCGLSGCNARELRPPSQSDETAILRTVIEDIEILRLPHTCLASTAKSSPFAGLANAQVDDAMRRNIAKSWEASADGSLSPGQQIALETVTLHAIAAKPKEFSDIKLPPNAVPSGIKLETGEREDCRVVYYLSRPAIIDKIAMIEVAWGSNPVGAGQGQTFALRLVNGRWKIIAKRVSFLV
jgi:hypothetical protein